MNRTEARVIGMMIACLGLFSAGFVCETAITLDVGRGIPYTVTGIFSALSIGLWALGGWFFLQGSKRGGRTR